MSSRTALLASLALHSAVICTVVALDTMREEPVSEEAEDPVPICFELVVESSPEQEAQDDSAAVMEKNDDTPEAEQEQEPEAEDESSPEAKVEPEAEAEPEAKVEPEAEAEPEAEPEAQPEREPEQETESAPSQAAEERAAVVSDPVALNRIMPVYPRAARRKGHEGFVTVEISVEDDGSVGHAGVVASSGFAELDEAAVSAVRSARFAPATEGGASVRGTVRLTFDFRLR